RSSRSGAAVIKHVEDGHRLRKALQHDGADIFQRGDFPNRSCNAAGDKDLAVFGFGTEASGEVAHCANCRVAGAVGKTNLAECGIPLRNAHAKTELTVALSPIGD